MESNGHRLASDRVSGEDGPVRDRNGPDLEHLDPDAAKATSGATAQPLWRLAAGVGVVVMVVLLGTSLTSYIGSLSMPKRLAATSGRCCSGRSMMPVLIHTSRLPSAVSAFNSRRTAEVA